MAELPSRERAAELAKEMAEAVKRVAAEPGIAAPTDATLIVQAYADKKLVLAGPPTTGDALAAMALEQIDREIAAVDTLGKARGMLRWMRERFATGLETVVQQAEWIDRHLKLEEEMRERAAGLADAAANARFSAWSQLAPGTEIRATLLSAAQSMKDIAAAIRALPLTKEPIDADGGSVAQAPEERAEAEGG